MSNAKAAHKTPRLYAAWMNMHRRCNNSNTKDYPYYGGRGISVCRRWIIFDLFATDMGPHPGPGWTLDRRNGHKGYRKSNCRWATRETQSRNRVYCKLNIAQAALIRELYEKQAGTKAQLAIRFGVSRSTVDKVTLGVAWR